MKLNLIYTLIAVSLTAVTGQTESNPIEFPVQGGLDLDLNDPKYAELWKEQVDLYVQSLENPEDPDKPEGRMLPLLLPDFGIIDILAPLFKKDLKGAKCELIKYAMKKVQTILRIPFTTGLLMKGAKAGCKKYGMPEDICDGYVDKYGPSYIEVFKSLNLNDGYSADLFTFALVRACPHPNLPETKISLPAPKPIYTPKASNRTMRVLHMSDLHFDPDYKQGAESICNKPICCHKGSQEGKGIKKPAGKWGEYKCDIPPATLESMLAYIQRLHQSNPIDMVIFGGDVPPHNAWQETWEHSKSIESQSFKMMRKYLNSPKTKVYPVVGNHEGIPSNLYPFDNMPQAKNFALYPFLADEWKDWIPQSAYNQVRKSGFYSVDYSDKLKVITMNNNLCYAYNVYLLLQPLNEDPNGMFAWLLNELQDAERRGMKVFISSHVPPASADCFQKFSQTYHKIVKSYAHVITAQFYGHTHWDEFEVYYKDGGKTKENAISNSFIVPSITTFTDINPGFRIYEVDAESFYVKDFIQYYADLNRARTWKAGPVWKELYRPKTTYNVPSSKGDYINAAFWHEVAELMKKDASVFNKFNSLKFKNSGKEPHIDDKERMDMICNLQASNSKEICRVKLEF